jgi:hypothetical protein
MLTFFLAASVKEINNKRRFLHQECTKFINVYVACSSPSYINSRGYLTSNKLKGVYVAKWKQL